MIPDDGWRPGAPGFPERREKMTTEYMAEGLSASERAERVLFGMERGTHRPGGEEKDLYAITKASLVRAIEAAERDARASVMPNVAATSPGPVSAKFDEVSCTQQDDCGWPECDCPRKDAPTGSFACPVCGNETPHHHSDAEVALRKEAKRKYYADVDHHPVYRRIFIDGGLFALSSVARLAPEVPAASSPDEAMREALELAEDVLSRAPFSTGIWPNGMHPNIGIEKIRKALAASPRSFDSTTDWLPIETAPKDEGRHILLHGNGSNFTDCSFVGYWTTYKEKEPGWQMMSSKIHVEPTLWMPLPTVVSRPLRRCQKCGEPTNSEEAYVDGQIWCHPCADAVVPSQDGGSQ